MKILYLKLWGARRTTAQRGIIVAFLNPNLDDVSKITIQTEIFPKKLVTTSLLELQES